MTSLLGAPALLSIRQPGMIVGPIATFLGTIYNLLFDFIYQFSHAGSLGIAIILFTLIVKLVLFPLMIKQQKSSYKMQKLAPEMNKIRDKYKDKKDPASQQKMAQELQAFQKSNGINMMGGCLPLLIQLPILYALFYIFQQAYLYVDVIHQNYQAIADAIIAIPSQLRMDVFGPYAQAFLDANKLSGFDMGVQSDVIMLVNHLNLADWSAIHTALGSAGDALTPFLNIKTEIESFLWIPLVYRAGLGFPGILIPILAAATTWLQSKLTMAQTPAPQGANDPTAAMTRSMLYVMPIMMGVMAITMPAGLGLYWIISNLFSIGQQMLLKKYFQSKSDRGEAEYGGSEAKR